MLIYFILSSLLALNAPTAVQAKKCGGLLTADNGNLEIESSSSSCLWVIELQNMAGISLELKQFTTEAILVIPVQNLSQANLQSFWMDGRKNTYTFEGKMLSILAPPRNMKASLSWAGVNAVNTRGTVNAKFERNSEGMLQWEQASDGTNKIVWAIDPEATGQFNWALKSYLWYCGCGNDAACSCSSFMVILVMPDGSIGSINRITEGSSMGSLTVEKNSKILVLLHMESTVGAGSLKVTWQSDEEPLKRNVEGVIVGTDEGLFIIGLNTSEKTRLSRQQIRGVAFDWISKRIYWAENEVGIMRANVDGSGFRKLLVNENVYGLAIEAMTGNLYYGSHSGVYSLRVCNNDAEKCSTIVKEEFYDFTFHQSKGLLFWSTGSEILRMNLDGTDSTQIFRGDAYEISVDERENRLYWGTQSKKGLKSCDLDGHNVTTLPNIAINTCDADIDGDTYYYSSCDTNTLHFVTKKGKKSTLVADFTVNPWHVVLFGKQMSRPRSNPCKTAKCAHLCVLITASSYRCVCSDGEELQKDEISCEP